MSDNGYHDDLNNVEKYTQGMKKSVLDKMFFLDKIIEDKLNIIDYGCGDGTLLREIIRFFPDNYYIGYDISKEMIEIARDNVREVDEGQILGITDDFDNLESDLNKIPEKSVVVLSSIIHEVYSYRSEPEIREFWERVFSLGDYVVIRDMIPSSSIDRRSYENDVRKIYKYADRECLLDFIDHWGDVTNQKNLIHYLLKYRYKDNWGREVRENYFPIVKEKLYSLIPEEYEISYEEHYVLPYIQEVVKNDFDIKIKDSTHLKLILKAE